MTQQLEVGQLRNIPIKLSTNTIQVQCLLVDQRTVFGRKEWQIAPVSGEGTAWITERILLGGLTPTVAVSEAFQLRHEPGYP